VPGLPTKEAGEHDGLMQDLNDDGDDDCQVRRDEEGTWAMEFSQVDRCRHPSFNIQSLQEPLAVQRIYRAIF
jgi:hypothetical protein